MHGPALFLCWIIVMSGIVKEIREKIYSLRDEGYQKFQAKLIPNIAEDTIIGVRTPDLKKLAGEYSKNEAVSDFLDELPHRYFEENQLHGFIINSVKDHGSCMELLKAFLPYIDNWATCDQLSPKIFKKHRPELLSEVRQWINSDRTYTIRFAIGMLMEHFLNEDFDEEYLKMVSEVRSGDYYVNMMVAWYFATALAKQYDSAVKYIEEHRLDDWTHNKAIQKAVESRRVSDLRKEYLKTLKSRKR